MYITAQGPVSEMTYTVSSHSSGTLNSTRAYTIPYHTVSLVYDILMAGIGKETDFQY